MELSITGINFLAAFFAAAIALFGIGGVWYSPWLFGAVWTREAGITNKSHDGGHAAFVYGISFLSSVVSAFAFAIALGEKPPVQFALLAGFVVGVLFVSTSFTINYLFGGRTLKLLAIDAGYHTLQFLIYGLILGLWH